MNIKSFILGSILFCSSILLATNDRSTLSAMNYDTIFSAVFPILIFLLFIVLPIVFAFWVIYRTLVEK